MPTNRRRSYHRSVDIEYYLDHHLTRDMCSPRKPRILWLRELEHFAHRNLRVDGRLPTILKTPSENSLTVLFGSF